MGQAMLKPCPICGKMAVEQYTPFCCKRCADVDLGRWLTESYTMPTEEKIDENDPSPDE